MADILTFEEEVHIAKVAEGSAMDYFAAAIGSVGEDSAAFMILAHTQIVSAMTMWGLIVRTEKSHEQDFERVSGFESDLRYELLLCARGSARVEADGAFPSTGSLPSYVQPLMDAVSKDFPRALSVGAQSSWERPYSNVHRGS